jgi:hypothetical protein
MRTNEMAADDYMTPQTSVEDPRLDNALEQLRSVLVEGETIEAWQCRLGCSR